MIDIRVSGLVKSFDLEKKILDGVSFQVRIDNRSTLERLETFCEWTREQLRSAAAGKRDIV